MSPIPERASGVLLHVSSLPGVHGTGELGAGALRFIDWLQQAGQRYWQVLPLGPTGYGESPYQLISGFAGNPLYIDVEALGETLPASPGNPGLADYAFAAQIKSQAIDAAACRFADRATRSQRAQFAAFQAANPWLDAHAIFVTLKASFDQKPWHEWPEAYATGDRATLAAFANRNAQALHARKLEQFWFESQWNAVRRYARERGIRIIGDCPIYVAHDSCEVWSARHLFDLDADGRPRHIAGVPPDYFSATGQRWGNPLYRWDRHAEDGYLWWRQRLARCITQFDLVRLDHFRGFDAYWSIPASCPTAVEGEWEPGPGLPLFEALRRQLGELPIIAEDLGLLTESVHALRRALDLPGMRVLQFGFDGQADNPHAPENIDEDVVCYTGTHDNDTTAGWYLTQDEAVRDRVAAGDDCRQAADRLIRLALASRARLSILPMQDILGLDGTARFNTPGVIGNNWLWRLLPGAATPAAAQRLKQQTLEFNR